MFFFQLEAKSAVQRKTELEAREERELAEGSGCRLRFRLQLVLRLGECWSTRVARLRQLGPVFFNSETPQIGL
jgi:hypothetical protein